MSHRLVISLATTPCRVSYVPEILSNLVKDQTPLRPNAIYIHVCRYMVRTRKQLALSGTINRAIQSCQAMFPETTIHFEVHDVDYGPITKLIPTLCRERDPETQIIVLDDDIRYPPQLCAELLNAQLTSNNVAHGLHGFTWLSTTTPQVSGGSGEVLSLTPCFGHHTTVDVLEGFASYIVKREWFQDTFVDYWMKQIMTEELLETSSPRRSAMMSDDLVVSGYLKSRGISLRLYASPNVSRKTIQVLSYGYLEDALQNNKLEHGNLNNYRKCLSYISDLCYDEPIIIDNKTLGSPSPKYTIHYRSMDESDRSFLENKILNTSFLGWKRHYFRDMVNDNVKKTICQCIDAIHGINNLNLYEMCISNYLGIDDKSFSSILPQLPIPTKSEEAIIINDKFVIVPLYSSMQDNNSGSQKLSNMQERKVALNAICPNTIKNASQQIALIYFRSISTKSLIPLVTILTPTYMRRKMFPRLIECVKRQTYPYIEWLIVEDGEETVADLVCELPFARLIRLSKKVSIGQKRNIMNHQAKGDIMVAFDDDDYHFPTRIENSVSVLNQSCYPIVGCSRALLHIEGNIWQTRLERENHATNGTFAYRSILLKTQKYDYTKKKAEESSFLQNYEIPLVELDPLQNIIVMEHDSNTVNKSEWLQNAKHRYVSHLVNLDLPRLIPDKNLCKMFLL